MKTSQGIVASFTALALLSGCGHDTSDRMLSGAGIGAGIGAVGSAVAGGAVLPAALIGGAVGAAAGGLTSDRDVDLGKPIWR